MEELAVRLRTGRRPGDDLVRAAARLNLPARQLDRALAVRPGTPGLGKVHARYMSGLRQAYRRRS